MIATTTIFCATVASIVIVGVLYNLLPPGEDGEPDEVGRRYKEKND